MDLSFEFNIGLPTDVEDWFLQMVPALIGIALETSNKRVPRLGYLIMLVIYLVSFLVVDGFASAIVVSVFAPNAAEATSLTDSRLLAALEPMAIVGLVVSFIFQLLLARLIVQRLHDGEITKWWACLYLIPVINVLIVLGLIFYPSSRAPAPVDVEVF